MAITTQPEDDTATTLIAVKAQVPPLRTGLVDRERLLSRLLEDEPGRLTVVIAPAGWGKTTLLGQWVRRIDCTCAVAWVSLDESDDEPVRFWTYALTALHTTAPTVAGARCRRWGRRAWIRCTWRCRCCSTRWPPPPSTMFWFSMTSTCSPTVHLHSQLEFLLAYAPPSLRVVIAGRSDPPLPLARLRAAGS